MKRNYLKGVIGLIVCLMLLHQAMAQSTPMNGKYKTYYRSGGVKESGKYKDGVKHGIWMYYLESGSLTRKEKWKMGTLLWQFFYEKGKLIRTIDKDGKETKRPGCGC